MLVISRLRWQIGIPIMLIILALLASLVFAFSSRLASHAASQTIVQISSDPYTNPGSQHKTEVEPDTYAFGSTIVSAFQVGRFYSGGASNIGWATSTNGGKSWTNGFLPSTTVYASPAGIYARASDASVAYDPKHNVWLISYLGLYPHGNTSEVDVVVSRSIDGGLNWGTPVAVNASGHFNDKNWTVCDDTASSPYYGNCYTEFDDNSLGDLIQMSTSTNGGKTWGAALPTANKDFGLGGQPLVQPNGHVIVPIVGFTSGTVPGIKTGPDSASQPFKMMSFVSTNGGASWSKTFKLAEVDFHVPQGIRSTIPLPSAEVDASGKVYVVWEDCRFEKGCPADDLVLSTSTNGTTWSAVKRIPIDPVGSGADHFIPGLAVDRSTHDGSAHLGLAYYYYPIANCQTATCELDVGFISSVNGGASWSKAEQLAGPMALAWLALTTQGYMTGDYISTSIVPGAHSAVPVFANALPPTTGTTCIASGTICNEGMYTTHDTLTSVTGGNIATGNEPTFVPPQKSIRVDHTAY